MAESHYLVTGATGGLGQALCLELAGAGKGLVLAGPNPRKLDRLADRLEKEHGCDPVIYAVDQAGATSADYDEMAAAITSRCGRLDGVVHLAASFSGLMPLMQVGADAWLRTFAINVHSVQWINQAVYGLLKVSGGTIAAAVDDPALIEKAYWGAYGASKSALAGLMQITREECEGDGVRVLPYFPGPIQTTLRAAAYVLDQEARPADTVAAELVELLLNAA